MKFRVALAAGIAGLVAVACAEGPTSPSAVRTTGLATASEPVIIAGNPVCGSTQGGREGLLFLGGTADQETQANTTYTITVDGLGTITYTTNADNTGIVSWSSTFPIDGVIMKGGNQGANLYAYSGAMSDGGELTPDNSRNEMPAEISHLNFCWYGRFAPSVDGGATYTRDFDWTIAKSASAPATVTRGSPLTVSYTVTMGQSHTDSDFAINGSVTVANNGYGAAGTVDGVSVDVGGTAATVACDVTFPATLADGGSFDCSYSASVSDASTRTVTATVAASGLWRPSSASTSVSFGDPTTLVDESATISDTRVPAGLGSMSSATTLSYDLVFGPYDACVPVTIDNTAGFVTNDNAETGSSSASVTVGVTGCSSEWVSVGTAFAYSGNPATSFAALAGIQRWGWSIQITAPGSYTYDVYAGAGQNDLSKGTMVGTVTITYTGSTVTTTYNLLPGYSLSEQHLYAGATAIPTVTQGKKTSQTVAPGQYTVNVSGGSIWVIAHSVVGYTQP